MKNKKVFNKSVMLGTLLGIAALMLVIPFSLSNLKQGVKEYEYLPITFEDSLAKYSNADKNVVSTENQIIALMQHYYKYINKVGYSETQTEKISFYADKAGTIEIGTAKVSAVVESRLNGTPVVSNKSQYNVTSGYNEITLNLNVAEDETIVLGGGSSDVGLYYVASDTVINDTGLYTVLNDNKYSSVIENIDGTNKILVIKVDGKFKAEKEVEETTSSEVTPTTPEVTTHEPEVIVDGSSLEATNTYAYVTPNTALVPFVYKDNTNFVNKKIESIKLNISYVEDKDEDSVFTISIFDINLFSATTVPIPLPLREYKINVSKDNYTDAVLDTNPENTKTYNKYVVNKWITVDVSDKNIVVSENEYFGISKDTDTIIFNYVNNASDNVDGREFVGKNPSGTLNTFKNEFKLPYTIVAKEEDNKILVDGSALEDTDTYEYKIPNPILTPFVYRQNDRLIGKTLGTIKLYIGAVNSITEDSTFTIGIYPKSMVNSNVFASPLREYTITIPKETFAGAVLDTDSTDGNRSYNKYLVNNWVTVDVSDKNITVASTELLGLFKETDTILFKTVYNGPEEFNPNSFYGNGEDGSVWKFGARFKLPYTITEKESEVEETTPVTPVSNDETLMDGSGIENTTKYEYKVPNPALTPFVYKTNKLSNTSINSIKLYVAAVNSLTEDSTFTISVFNKSILNASVYPNALREYTITVSKDNFTGGILDTDTTEGNRTSGKYIVNKWITVDLTDKNIVLGEDELLGLFKESDTMLFKTVYNIPATDQEINNLDRNFVGRKPSEAGINYFNNNYQLPYTIKGKKIITNEKKYEQVLKALSETNQQAGANELKNILSGKKVSILGDSISTYQNISNNNDYNNTLSANAVWYGRNLYSFTEEDDMPVTETWWRQTIDRLGLEFVVNNSYSGGQIWGEYSRGGGRTISAQTRCTELHNNSGVNPELVLYYMGTNDFQYYGDLDHDNTYEYGSLEAINFDELIINNGNGTYTYKTPETFAEAYSITIHKMQTKYPGVQIVSFTLPKLAARDNEEGYRDLLRFNSVIRSLADHFNLPVVDLFYTDLYNRQFQFIFGGKTNETDKGGVHPDMIGMDMITDKVIETLYNRYVEGKTTEYYHKDNEVTYDKESHTTTLEVTSSTNAKVYYSTEKELNDSNYTEGTTTKPTFTNAGTYNINWYIEGTRGLLSASGRDTLRINKLSINPTVADIQNQVYTGEEIKPSVIVKVGSEVLPESEYTVTYVNNIETGEATVNISAKSDGNYTFSNIVKNFTIYKESLSDNELTLGYQVNNDEEQQSYDLSKITLPSVLENTSFTTVIVIENKNNYISDVKIQDNQLMFKVDNTKKDTNSIVKITVTSSNKDNYYVKLNIKSPSSKVYSVIDGNNQEIIIEETKEVTFRIDAALELFESVYVDDILVSSDNYTLESGSTIIKLKDEFVKTLPAGKHTLRATYSDGGVANATFEIKAAPTSTNNAQTPNTYDGVLTWVIVLVSATVAAGVSIVFLKKNLKK